MKIHRTTAGHGLLPLLSAGLLLGSGFLIGCGGPPVPHSGKPKATVTVAVTYGGQPVAEGRVDLANEQTGEAGGAELGPDGVATIPEMALGSFTVIVVPPHLVIAPTATGPATPPAKKEYPNIPVKVRTTKTSPLKAEVKKDSPNKFKFDLKEAAVESTSPSPPK
jgi:hypothetical protein